MKKPSVFLVFLMSVWAAVAQADLRFVSARVTEDRVMMTVLENGHETRLRFEASAALDLAARRITMPELRDETPPLLKNARIEFTNEESFQKFLRLWTASPRPLLWKNVFGNPDRQNGRVFLSLQKAWRLTGTLESKPSKLMAALLACSEEDFRFCLGNTREISNPNLVTEVPAILTGTGKESLHQLILPTDAELRRIFTSVGYPDLMAQFYATWIQARREALLGISIGEWQAKTQQLNALPWLKKGIFDQLPEEVEADFSLENLETRLNLAVEKSLETLNSAGQYMLGHFPYMGLETDIGQGKWMLETGFMYRVKRKIEKNVRAQNPQEVYRVQDSLDIMLTLGLGRTVKNDRFRASLVAGSGYLRHYAVSSFFASYEEARRGYWMLSKELLWTGKDLTVLRPGESFRVAHGGLVMGNASANVKTSKFVRPGGYIMPIASYLWSFQATRDSQGRFLISNGNDLSFDLNLKFFWRSISRFLRVPMAGVNWKKSTTSSRTYVFPENSVQNPESPWRTLVLDFLRTGDERALPANTPMVSAKADYASSNHWLYLGLRNVESRNWQGWINVKDPTGAMTRSDVDQKKYFVVERRDSRDGKNLFTSTSFHEHCSYWGGLQTDRGRKVFEDGSFRFSCRIGSNVIRELPVDEVLRLGRLMNLSEKDLSELRSLKERPKGEVVLSLRGAVPWSDLRDFVAGREDAEWLRRFQAEIDADRLSRANQIQDMRRGLDRFHLLSALTLAMNKQTPEDRFSEFFQVMSQSTNRDLFLIGFLEKLSKPSLEVRVFIPSEASTEAMEKVYRRGDFTESPDFELFQDHERSLNIPW